MDRGERSVEERCWLSLVAESSQEGCPEGQGAAAGTPARVGARPDAGPLGGEGGQRGGCAGGQIPQPHRGHPGATSVGRGEAVPAGPTWFSGNGCKETLHRCSGGSGLLFLLVSLLLIFLLF